MAYETNAPAGRSDDTLRSSEDLSDAAAEAASEAEAVVSDLGHEATRRAEHMRTSAAEGLDSAASAVHAGGEQVANAARRAGDALAAGAEYVRGNEVADMLDDLVDVVRNHPAPALLCAAALGFVLGRAVSRS
jgi:ElaB/YqjD/DUF883 family membrane-anchored ribosome-binding protein